MKALIIAIIAIIGLFAGMAIYGLTRPAAWNIEHDGHLFIKTRTSIIHHPACSCQSSLKAIRASQQ